MTAGDNEYLFDNAAHQAGGRFGALASLFDPVTIRHVEEWTPTPQQVEETPDLADEMDRPMLLIVAAER